jgi:CheY-like chemotaxis protein
MAEVLLVDDIAPLAGLFADAVRSSLGHTVHTVDRLDAVDTALANLPHIDLALVDLSFAGQDGTGIDALVSIHRRSPDTRLAIITQGDTYVADTLRDAWELLPIATVIAKSTPLAMQMNSITMVLRDGSAPPDPAVRLLLPEHRNAGRTPASFARLVQHAGHAKLWTALWSVESPTYKSISDYSGLKLNTLKNYRAQIVLDLATHGLNDPSLSDLRAFALRCRPFLRPYVQQRASAQ